MNKVSILGVKFDAITKQEAVQRAMEAIRQGKKGYVVTPNSEIVYMARSNPQLKKLLNAATLVLPDGIGIVHAAKILKKPLTEKVAGIEFAADLIAEMEKEGRSLFLFGAKPGVAETAKKNLEQKYPGLQVCGTHDGYFKPEDEDGIIDAINQSGAKLLLVCLGAPKQEKWIAAHKDALCVNLCMGVGGALDVFAGTVKRAPELFIKCNLEWLYRFIKQPSRLNRFAALPKFMLTVKKEG